MVRFIRTGQMRHDERGPLCQCNVAQCGPFGQFHAEPVHAGVKLYAKRMPRQAFDMDQQLIDRIDHRGQLGGADHVGITRHVT